MILQGDRRDQEEIDKPSADRLSIMGGSFHLLGLLGFVG